MASEFLQSVAFVGGGNMGGAIARGIVQVGLVGAERVMVADPSEAVAEGFAALGVQTFADASQMIAQGPDIVVLAVKPQVLPSVVSSLTEALDGHLVVSIAAGVKVATLEQMLPGARVVRVMPNLPLQVQSGATAICAGSAATTDDLAAVKSIFGALGAACVMREDQLDAEGAVVGCEPAYVALFVDDMVRAAIEHGMFAQDARQMVLSTMKGVATQLLESGEHPRAYMEKVMSPGGTTVCGVRAMEEQMFCAVTEAVDAAARRTRELAGE